ncbi:hypothetical protein Esti_006183 [Eimeria stiedai]
MRNRHEIKDEHLPPERSNLELPIPQDGFPAAAKSVNEGGSDASGDETLSEKEPDAVAAGGCTEAGTAEDGGLASALLQTFDGSTEDAPAAAEPYEEAEAAPRRLAATQTKPTHAGDIPPQVDVKNKTTEKHAALAAASPSAAPFPNSLASAGSCFSFNQRFVGGEVVEAMTPHECRAKCLSRPGCLHFNFLFKSKACEHVFAKIEPAQKKDFEGALSASVECLLPHGTLLYSSSTIKKGSAASARMGLAESVLFPKGENLPEGTEFSIKHAGGSEEAVVEIRSNEQSNPHRSQVCSDIYVLSDTFRGSDFWNPAKFFFFEWGDPTGGTVEYVSTADAQRYKLINSTSDGRAQIYADSTETLGPGKGRKSAMFVMDLNHMPTGCGTWPAWWTVGWDPWPDTGEIDIIEGANLQNHAHSALHTKKGCVMPSSTANFNGYWSRTSSGSALNCWNLATPDNTGCSIESYEDAYGAPLNRKGGGLYVMQLHHDKYIRVWFFTRQEAPADLKAGNPTPDFWTKTPLAYFTLGSSCPGSYFGEQRIVLNTTFCGGYSGYNFTTANGCPGNGLADCESYVRRNPSAFKEAYWDISFMKVYRRSGQTCQTPTTTTFTTTRKTSEYTL